MINFKQQELIDTLFQEVKVKYPEIQFIKVTRSPDGPDHILVKIVPPEDEDRRIEMMEFSAERGLDILLNYGYHISLIPSSREPLRQAA